MNISRTLIFVVPFLITHKLGAQNAGLGDPAAAPGTPASSYSLSGIDNVNYYNGSVEVSIPVLNIGGRGAAAKSVAVPIQRLWTVTNVEGSGFGYPDSSAVPGPYYTAGDVQAIRVAVQPNVCSSQDQYGQWTYSSLGPLTTYILWTSGKGTRTILYDTTYNGQKLDTDLTQCSQLSTYQYADRGTVFRSMDGSDLTFIADTDVLDGQTSGAIAGTVITRDGLKIHFAVNNCNASTIATANVIEDRNGNKISLSWQSDPAVDCGGTYTITDPAGRQEKITYPGYVIYGNTAQDTLTYPGYTGTQRQVTVNYGLLSNVGTLASGETQQTFQCLFPEISGASSSVYNDYVVTSIVQPDGSQYSMQYNAYGELVKLTLPTGGYYKYIYPEASNCTAGTGSGVITLANSAGWDIYRRLQERDEYSDGVNLSGKVVFTATASTTNLDPNHPSRPGTTVQADFQDASGTLLRRETHYYYGDPSSNQAPPTDPTQPAPWWIGREFMTKIGSATTTLQTRRSVYGQRPCNVGENCVLWGGNPQADTVGPHDTQVCQTSIMLDSGQTSGLVLAYDQYNNVTNKWEFDFGAAPSIGPNCPASPTTGFARLTSNAYITQSQYTTPSVNLLSLLSSTSISTPSLSNYGNATYTYDVGTISDAPGIIGHDPNYGTSFAARGNPTTISRFSSSLGSNISTTLTYDIAGNVISVTDQNGHSTTLQYTDSSNTYSHPTQQTNALGQVSTALYDNAGTGKITTSTDANGAKTTYTYNDPLDRLTLVAEGVGTSVETHTTLSYPATTEMSQYQDQNTLGDQALRTDTLTDALGRPQEARTYESATAYISTTQTYDALGRVATTTNPSRTGDGLGYATTYFYDSLGRQTQIVFPDNSTASVAYSGNQVTATDQAGKVRTTLTDGLGRLTSVTEDPGTTPQHLAYSTSYTYDPLDNLIQVTQSGQTRTFNYDNLGWLTSVVQPEAGTISYIYDGVGNLTRRTDARSIQTNYTYDALNRPMGKTYSDGTPAVTYCYDGVTSGACAGGPAGPGFIGRQTMVASSASMYQYTGYDALGRVTASQQITNGQTPYTFSYAYNRASALTSETYPSGRTVSTGYDLTNRPTSLSGTLNNNTTTYASAFSYAPHGGILSMTFGNNIAQSEGFNSLLQPTQIQAGSLLTLGYTYLTGSNDGDPQTQTVTRSGVSSTQSYNYDAVNRLTCANQVSGSTALACGTGSPTWSQTYGFDAFGNRWLSTYNGLPAPTNEVPQSPTWIGSNNRIAAPSPWTYDGAGNVLAVGGMSRSFIYDADNRQTSASVNGTTTTYVYDGGGQRVMKTVGSNTATTYVYDAFSRLVAEYGSTNPDTGTRYLSTDHLGSTRLVTKGDGTVDRTFDYLPFGEEIGGMSSAGLTQRFTGQERDTESGLDNFTARYTSAPQGRFQSPDPLGMVVASLVNPQSWNLYSYASNNPLVFIDPSGFCDMSDWFTNCDAGSGIPGIGGNSPSSGGWANSTFGNYGWGSYGIYNGGGFWMGTPVFSGGEQSGTEFNWVSFVNSSGGGSSGGGESKACVQTALRAVIAHGEGMDKEPNGGYGTVVRGKVISAPGFPNLVGTFNAHIADPSALSGHPNIMVQVGPGLRSSAFGRYQLLSSTANGIGATDFSPAGQDAVANTLMGRRGMIAPAMAGQFAEAMRRGGPEWSSLPTSPNHQPRITMGDALVTYVAALAACK